MIFHLYFLSSIFRRSSSNVFLLLNRFYAFRIENRPFILSFSNALEYTCKSMAQLESSLKGNIIIFEHFFQITLSMTSAQSHPEAHWRHHDTTLSNSWFWRPPSALNHGGDGHGRTVMVGRAGWDGGRLTFFSVSFSSLESQSKSSFCLRLVIIRKSNKKITQNNTTAC